MSFLLLFLKNIFNFPLICFFLGLFLPFLKINFRLFPTLSRFLTVSILFCIGLKGGGPLVEHLSSSAFIFAALSLSLIVWGLFSPFLSFYLLKVSTQIDRLTAAAIAASFGSVSVMTFVTAISFLDQLQVSYQQMMIAILAIMEIPAIIAGVFLGRKGDGASLRIGKVLRESIFNKAIISIVSGLIVGAFFYSFHLTQFSNLLLVSFKPLLCLFLFDMGLLVGAQREHFTSFSRGLNLFGIYMPLLGGGFGLFLSYILGLDPGTGTLIAVLTASASYIAVPAAMRIALPEAKEAIYLSLSLGIAFPFNVMLGIPLYYYLAYCFLG